MAIDDLSLELKIQATLDELKRRGIKGTSRRVSTWCIIDLVSRKDIKLAAKLDGDPMFMDYGEYYEKYYSHRDAHAGVVFVSTIKPFGYALLRSQFDGIEPCP